MIETKVWLQFLLMLVVCQKFLDSSLYHDYDDLLMISNFLFRLFSYPQQQVFVVAVHRFVSINVV